MQKLTKKKHLLFYGCSALGVNMMNLMVGSYLCSALLTGGFGEHFLANITYSVPRDIIAIDNVFVPHGKNSELYEYCGLSSEKIYQRILKCL